MAMIPNNRHTWIVLNQAQSPAFQEMLARLSAELGPCLCYTGMPYPIGEGPLTVESGHPYDRRGVPRRALSWLRFTVAAALRVLRAPGKPFLFAVTNPPVLPIIVWLLHAFIGYPYGLLIWDINPDHLVRLGLLKRKGLVAQAWTALNRRTMLGARVVITISDRMADALRAHLGSSVARVRIEVIPNWADTDWLRPIPKDENPFALEHGQVGKLTVLYSGNMGADFGLDTVIEAARQVQDDPRIAFLLIGDGLGRAEVEKKTALYHLNNVVLLPLQPYERLPYSLAAGDIALVVQPSGAEHLSLPSKTYSALAVGSAVIALTRGDADLAYLVQTHDLGMVCPPGDAEALALAIRTLAEDAQRLAGCRARARQAAVDCYCITVVKERFRAVLGAAMAQGAAV